WEGRRGVRGARGGSAGARPAPPGRPWPPPAPRGPGAAGRGGAPPPAGPAPTIVASTTALPTISPRQRERGYHRCSKDDGQRERSDGDRRARLRLSGSRT